MNWHAIADAIEGAGHEALLGDADRDRWFHHEVTRIRSEASAASPSLDRDRLLAAVDKLEPRSFAAGHEPSGWYYDGWDEAIYAVRFALSSEETT